MLKIVDVATLPEHKVTNYAQEYSFPLDPFQEHAISAIDQEHNVLVCAKTGSGKTLVAEYAIAHCLKQGKRVFYTTPIKSLSNQKFHDLRQMWPGKYQVGIMTGDIKVNPDAQVVVMTTELLRNLLYKQGTATEHIGLTASLTLQNVGAVIFDECHYINDRDRGKVWEETMILLPKDIQLILLSATLDKPELFAGWLGELKQVPCHLIQTQYRIVPLTHYVWHNGQLRTIMDSKEVFHDDVYADWARGRTQEVKDHEAFQKKVALAKKQGHEGPVGGKTRPQSFQHQLNELIRHLHDKTLVPALCFVLSRKGCERLAAHVEQDLLDSSDVSAALNIFDFHLRKHKENLEKMPQYHTLRRLLQKGVSFHHSGVLPLLKEVIEILFSKGYVKLLFCTETFAVGLNMPTKTAIFTQLTKYDDATGGMRLLRTDEYIQMAGRAGRRGKDPIGTVIYLPDREPPTTAEMRSLMKGGKPQVQSRMDFHYDFLLKTLQSENLRWMDIQDNSYWMRQHKAAIKAQEREVQELEAKAKQYPMTEEAIQAMEEKDTLELRVKVETNAKRKEAQRLLDRWKDSHVGMTWHTYHEHWKQLNLVIKQTAQASVLLNQMYANRGNVEDWLNVLRDLDFIDANNKLRTKGILASECNENHTLLAAEFYIRGYHKKLTPFELFTTLASFIDEKETDATPTLEQLEVPQPVKDAMMDLDTITRDFCKVESKYGVYSREDFWTLSTTWVEPVWRWLQGEDAAKICSDYGLFEGNFVRAILRVSNMVDEWNAMATYMADVELLDKFRDLQDSLIRGVLQQDSLYLHL